MQPFVTCHIGWLRPLPKRLPPLGLLFPRPVQPHVRHLPPHGPLFPHLVHPQFLSPGPKHGLPPQTRPSHPPLTRAYPDMMWAPHSSRATPERTRTSSQTRGKRTRSERGSTPTLPPSLQGTSPPTTPSHKSRMPRPPLLALPRARRIRAPSRPPKSSQPATACLPPSHRSRFLRPREDSTFPVLPPPSTNKLP